MQHMGFYVYQIIFIIEGKILVLIATEPSHSSFLNLSFIVIYWYFNSSLTARKEDNW